MNQRRGKRNETPAGLRELQEVFSAISLPTPGQWFAVDDRGRYIRARLRARVDGREETLSTARLTLEVLRDVMTMERSAFRARLEKFLRQRGFEIPELIRGELATIGKRIAP